ncbi:MAG: carbon storage regulator, partial [Pirellulales bacterium]|nr:carbon storage regulator [Pirellulales bacterium]
MLVLSRKERQRIKLGESIVVTVVRVSGDRVRLGIEAPSDVVVLREELDDDGVPIAAEPRAAVSQADVPAG